MHLSALLFLAALATPGGLIAPQGGLRVGDIVDAHIETPHPYVYARSIEPRLVWSEELYLPEATYVAPFFSRFELAPGDYVVLRSPNGRRSWRFEGLGRANRGASSGFWGIHVPGERMVIELYSQGVDGSGTPAYGFRIDSAAKGFGLYTEAICGADDKENAPCYTDTEPTIYQQSRAVARLLIQGASLCTGWLVGSEGHLMTNNHCMSTEAAVDNTDYEFLAEGATCETACPQLACPGDIVTTTGTLVQTDANVDFTLIELSVNPTDTYGFFQMRESGPVIDERLYIPQHPGGRGKEIAVVSTHENDASGFPEVDDIFDLAGTTVASYYGDTEGGSSGSPVVAHSDNCVVTLHFGTFGCAGAGNTGSISSVIIDTLTTIPADAVVSDGSCGPTGEDIFADGFESGDVASWSSAVGLPR